jgi:hypothetical protein
MSLTCPGCANPLPFRKELVGRKIRCSICQSKFRLNDDLSIDLLERSKRSYLGPQITRNISPSEFKKMKAEDSLAMVLEEQTILMKEELPAKPKLKKKAKRYKPGETAFSWWPMLFMGLSIVLLPVSVAYFRPDLIETLKSSFISEAPKESTAVKPSTLPTPNPGASPKAHLMLIDQSFGSGKKINSSQQAIHDGEVSKWVLEFSKREKEYQYARTLK